MTRPDLTHFKPYEFRGWWDHMDPKLLTLLDEFRDRLGFPVVISPAKGAIGRQRGPTATTQHNIDRWGVVRAVDVLPQLGRRYRSMALDLAKEVGFTGIGVYPDWSPSWGMHLDVRRDREPGDPALWSGLKIYDHDKQRTVQVYRAVAEGLA